MADKDKVYVVTAPCAVIYNTDRSAAVTIPRGTRVPLEADPAHVKLLLERGLIEESDDVAGGIDHDPTAAPPFPQPQEAPKGRRGAGKDDE